MVYTCSKTPLCFVLGLSHFEGISDFLDPCDRMLDAGQVHETFSWVCLLQQRDIKEV